MTVVHKPDDLHAAALVWYSRSKEILALLAKDFPELPPNQLNNVLRACHTYTTCRDDAFTQLYADAMEPWNN